MLLYVYIYIYIYHETFKDIVHWYFVINGRISTGFHVWKSKTNFINVCFCSIDVYLLPSDKKDEINYFIYDPVSIHDSFDEVIFGSLKHDNT